MRNFIKLTVKIGILAILSLNVPSYAEDINLKRLTSLIENSLNRNDIAKLKKIIHKDIALDLEKRYLSFRKDFPNAKWVIIPSNDLQDNRKSIELLITGEKKLGKQVYTLNARQKLALEINNGEIINREVISEYSILSTSKQSIDITLQIPDVALTGSWYDIDIIIDQPLKNSIIAGGLIPFQGQEHSNNLLKDDLQLRPMGSGGIFKSVKAPLNPGQQRWAAIIAHPEGVISITKMVRIVSNKEDFSY